MRLTGLNVKIQVLTSDSTLTGLHPPETCEYRLASLMPGIKD